MGEDDPRDIVNRLAVRRQRTVLNRGDAGLLGFQEIRFSLRLPLAACRGCDPNLFFPEQGCDASYARSICRSCPEREPCLQEALRNEEQFGIWGGTNGRERRKLRQEVAAAERSRQFEQSIDERRKQREAILSSPDPDSRDPETARIEKGVLG